MPVDIITCPAKGASGFEETVRSSLAQRETVLEALYAEVEAARKGLASLLAMINTLVDGTAIAAESITEAQLDILDAPADGEALSWNAGSGKPEWIPFGSATDTKQVKMDAADSEGYLGTKVDLATILVNGSKKFYVPAGTTSAPGVVSVNTLDFSVTTGAVSKKLTSFSAKTVSYFLTADDLRGNVVFTNSGASGEVILYLPAGVVGHELPFEVVTAQYLQIKCNGTETLGQGADVTAAGGYIRCRTIGGNGCVYWNGTRWAVKYLNEYWSKDI